MFVDVVFAGVVFGVNKCLAVVFCGGGVWR